MKKTVKYLCLATGLAAFARETMAEEDFFAMPKTKEECVKHFGLPIDDPSALTPDKMCENNGNLPLNAGDCQDVYRKILDVFRLTKERLTTGCELAPKYYSFSQRCDAQMSQQSCVNEYIAMETEAQKFIADHRANIKILRDELQKAIDMGLDVAKRYADHLEKMEKTAAQGPSLPMPAAREVGVDTADKVLEVHAYQRAAEIEQLVEKMRNASTISTSDVDSIRSPLVYETVQGAQVASDMKRDLGEYDRELAQREADSRKAVASSRKNTTNMKSVEQQSMAASTSPDGTVTGNGTPASLTSGTSPALTAAGGLGSLFGGSNTPMTTLTPDQLGQPPIGEGLVTTTANAEKPTYNLAGSGRTTGFAAGSKPVIALAAAKPGEAAKEGVVQNSAASRTGDAAPNMRDRLRARLAESKDGGTAGSRTGASTAAPGSAAGVTAAGVTAGSARKPGDPSFRGLASGDFSSAAGLGGPNLAALSPLSLSGSDTDASVKDLVQDFQGALGEEANGTGAEGTMAATPDIGDENSPSLFLRMKDVVGRCLKRGCVVGTGKKEQI